MVLQAGDVRICREATCRCPLTPHLAQVHADLFIIDAIITIPIALLGFVFLPGLPWNAKPSFWLSGAVRPIARCFSLHRCFANASLVLQRRRSISRSLE